MTARTPGDLARLDQDLAQWNNQLDQTIPALREQIAESGEFQAFANLSLATTMLTETERRNLLLAALWRLARQPEQPCTTQTTGEPRS